jgi:hypothetical protein
MTVTEAGDLYLDHWAVARRQGSGKTIVLADLHDILAAARRALGWPQRGRTHCVPKRSAESGRIPAS